METLPALPEVHFGSVFGPRLGSVAVEMTMQQRVPCRRTREFLGALMRERTLTSVIKRTAALLIPVEEPITAARSWAKGIHQEETSAPAVSGCL